jgi:GNAT superfamily N-acetyltransferase
LHSITDVEIRRVNPGEWQRVRDLRLRALQGEPDAFGSTYGQEAEAGEDVWRSWSTGWPNAADQALFAAMEDGVWLGMALGVRWEPGEPEDVHLYAMWVEPSFRRQGIGRVLVGSVVEWATDLGAARVTLRVTEDHRGAVALYERSGFVDTGVRELLREGSDTTTALMHRSL